MLKLFTYVALLSGLPFHCVAQWIGSDSIDVRRISSWEAKSRSDYQGVYKFGDSEWESELLIIVTPNDVIAQIRSGHWSADGRSWMTDFENLDEVAISTNRFLSTKSDGEFVYFDDGHKKNPALKIRKSWSDLDDQSQFEVGLLRNSVSQFLPGKFNKASLQYLQKPDLLRLSKTDLRIMRNEIYARYGLIFKANGEMDKYFRAQEWYTGVHQTVEAFLTPIEKMNIALIQSME